MSTRLPAEGNEPRCGSAIEIYGSETLPVLIRLPDLAQRENRVRAETARSDSVERTQDSARAPDSEGAERGGLRQRRERRLVRARTQAQRVRGASWLPKAGHLLTSVVLAGVLFALFVSVKERNERPSPQPPAAVGPLAEPVVDIGEPSVELGGPAFSERDAKRLFQSAGGSGEQFERPAAAPARSSSALDGETAVGVQPAFESPVAVGGGAGDRERPAGPATPYSSYPTMGIDPVRAGGPDEASRHAAPAWRHTLPGSGTARGPGTAPPGDSRSLQR
ncbi:MAG: hypothetical protein FJ276_11180 [Planctomycetes bacterium]|nr:hypothetical protein [Planctomycetota bacterium]